jgi:hypothetical protein
LTSPENGVAVKNEAALSNARPNSEGAGSGSGCPAAASVIETTLPSSFRMLLVAR